jgi:hypothetical protein
MSHGKILRSNGRYTGEISTVKVFCSFYMEPNPEARGKKSPTHIMKTKGPTGREAPAGVVWANKIKSGESVGQDMFSILLDEEYGENMRFSAFPSGQPDQWVIQRERTRQDAQPAAAPDHSHDGETNHVPF